MSRILSNPFPLVLLLFNLLTYRGLAQRPFAQHKFASGMVYSWIGGAASKKNGRLMQAAGQSAKGLAQSGALTRHYVLAGGLALTVDITGTTCGYSNGSFVVAASGGVPPYLYSENGSPYQSNGYFEEKAAGTYTITVQDASGNTATTAVTLTNTYASPVIGIQSSTDPTGCSGSNGSVVIAGTGGSPPYLFNMDDGTYGNSNTFGSLPAGEYYFGVQDQNGCVAKKEVTLTGSCSMQLSGYSYSELICFPNTGEIDIMRMNGGTPPYQYSLDGIHYQSSGNFTGLSVGEWTVYVKDATGLVLTTTFSIGNYCSLYVSVVSADAACRSDNGTLTATGRSGTPPYMYSIDGTNFQSSGVFSGLAPGDYTVTIKDVTGFTNYSDAVVYSDCPTVLATVTDAVCGQSDGSIQGVVQGGTAPYSYSLNGTNFTSGSTFPGLSAGVYTLTIKDAHGYTATTTCTVGNVCVMLSATPIDGTCGNSNGIINVVGTGGTPPYEYSINGVNFQSAGTFNGLAASTYTVTIKDASGLTNTTTVTVGNSGGPSITRADVSGASCANNDGSITIDASGGLAPLIYSVDGVNFQSSPDFDMLTSGVYIASVKDGNGCVAVQSATVPLQNTVIANAGSGATICQGDSILLSASTNGNRYSWRAAVGLSDTLLLGPKAIPASTTTYYFTASLGACESTDSVTIAVIPAPVANAGTDTSTCYGKDLTLQGSGGVSYQWTPSLYLSNPNSEDPVVQDPIQSIAYSLVVKNADGCRSIAAARINLTVTPPAAIFAGDDTSIAVGQPLALHAADVNGSGFTNFSWTPPDGLSNSFVSDPTAILDRSGTYTYTVSGYTSDGCGADGKIVVNVYQQADIYVPNAFTPNGDGHNDVLKAIPVGIRDFKYFVVYDRWGQLVFRTTDPGAGWDGRTAGMAESGSTFVWVAAGIDYMGKPVVRKGTVIMIR